MARLTGRRRGLSAAVFFLAALLGAEGHVSSSFASASASEEGCQRPFCQSVCVKTAADLRRLGGHLPTGLRKLNVTVGCRHGAHAPPCKGCKGLPETATAVHLALSTGRIESDSAEALSSLVARADGELRQLALHLGGVSMPAAGLRKLCGSLPEGLESLHVDIGNVQDLDDEAVQALSSRLRNMSLSSLALHLSGTSASGAGWAALAKSLPEQLGDLDLRLGSCNETVSRALSLGLSRMPLRRLVIGCSDCVDASLADRLPKTLEELNFLPANIAFNDTVVHALCSRLTQMSLRRLSLKFDHQYTRVSVDALERLANSLPEQLEALELQMGSLKSFSDTVAQALGSRLQRTHLRRLALQMSHGCTGGVCGEPPVSAIGLQSLAESLPEQLEDIQLTMNNNKNFGDAAARALSSRLPHIRLRRLSLRLSSTNLSATGAEALAKGFPEQLQDLELDSLPLNDTAAVTLGAQLQRLRLHRLRIVEEGYPTRLSADGRASLAEGLPETLEDLEFSMTRGGTKSLQALSARLRLMRLRRFSYKHNNHAQAPLHELLTFANSLPLTLEDLTYHAQGTKAFPSKVARAFISRLQHMQLRSLTLSLYNTGIGAAGYEILAAGLPKQLEDLTWAFQFEKGFDDKAAHALGSRFRHLHLRRLTLVTYQTGNLSSSGLESIVKGLPEQLEDMKMFIYTTPINDAFFDVLSKRFEQTNLWHVDTYFASAPMEGLCRLAEAMGKRVFRGIGYQRPIIKFTSRQDAQCIGLQIQDNIMSLLANQKIAAANDWWTRADFTERMHVMDRAKASPNSWVKSWAQRGQQGLGSTSGTDGRDEELLLVGARKNELHYDQMWRRAPNSTACRCVLAAIASKNHTGAQYMMLDKCLTCSSVLEQAVSDSSKSGVNWAVKDCPSFKQSSYAGQCPSWAENLTVDTPIRLNASTEARPALFIAALDGNADMVKHLIDYLHAKVDAETTATKRTALFAALGIDNRSHEARGLGNRSRDYIWRFLLEQGADINHEDHFNETPMCIFAGGSRLYKTSGNSSMLEKLAKHGANPHKAMKCIGRSEGSTEWKAVSKACKDWDRRQANQWWEWHVQYVEWASAAFVLLVLLLVKLGQFRPCGQGRKKRSTKVVTLVYDLRVCEGFGQGAGTRAMEQAGALEESDEEYENMFDRKLVSGTELRLINPLVLPRNTLDQFALDGAVRSRPCWIEQWRPNNQGQPLMVSEDGNDIDMPKEEFLQRVGVAAWDVNGCVSLPCSEEEDGMLIPQGTQMVLVWLDPEGVEPSTPQSNAMTAGLVKSQPSPNSRPYMIPTDSTAEGLRDQGHGPMWMHFTMDYLDAQSFNMWILWSAPLLTPDQERTFLCFVLPVSWFGWVLPLVSLMRMFYLYTKRSKNNRDTPLSDFMERVRLGHSNIELMFDLIQLYVIYLTQQVFKFEESEEFWSILFNYLNQLTTVLDLLCMKGPQVVKKYINTQTGGS